MDCIICDKHRAMMNINKLSDEILEFLLIKKDMKRTICFKCYLDVKKLYNLEKLTNKLEKINSINIQNVPLNRTIIEFK